MLETTKSVSLAGAAKINGQQVVYLSANITTESAGSTSINQNIQNQALYLENRTELRKDIDNFQDKVWEIEDEMIAEKETAVTPVQSESESQVVPDSESETAAE